MRAYMFVLLSSFYLPACNGLDEAGCPVDKPSNGQSCDSDGKVCEYQELDGSNPNCDDQAVYGFRCEGGVWVDYGAECQCPSDLPEAGSDCLGYQDTFGCSYCGGGGPVAECGSETDYLWQVSGTCP